MLSAALLGSRHVATNGSFSTFRRTPAVQSMVKAHQPSSSCGATKLTSHASLPIPGLASTRSIHLSAHLASESARGYKRSSKEAPRQRSTGSKFTSSRSSRPSSNSASKSPSRSAPRREYAEKESNHRQYRREADAIEYKSISSHPKISMTEVSFSRSKFRQVKEEEEPAPYVDQGAIMPTVVIEGFNNKYGLSSLPINAAVRPGSAIDEEQTARAKSIASQLSIPYYDTPNKIRLAEDPIDFALVVGANSISLTNLQEDYSPVVFSDFIGGATAHRQSTGGSARVTPFIRSIAVADLPSAETHVVDATGGLGVDGFMIASAGFKVTILEKNPLVYTLLADAYQRASQVPHLKETMSRITLEHTDAFDWFAAHATSETSPDVVYLDPMYPIESKMKALPKKGMALARALVGKLDRADDLVRQALTCAKKKVILKRPYYSDESTGTACVFRSRSLRFEQFTRESWNTAGVPSVPRVPTAAPVRTL